MIEQIIWWQNEAAFCHEMAAAAMRGPNPAYAIYWQLAARDAHRVMLRLQGYIAFFW